MDSRQAIINSFGAANPQSVGVYKMISEVYPAFAKKLFANNKFMEMVVMTNMSPKHILEYPICGRCETLAVYKGFVKKGDKYVRTCGCFADGCGHTTINPVTFRTWLTEEMKKKAPADFVEMCSTVADELAIGMMRKYAQEITELQQEERGRQKQKLGLVDIYGNPVKQESCKPTITKESASIDMSDVENERGEERDV